jgi:hypothetical protein
MNGRAWVIGGVILTGEDRSTNTKPVKFAQQKLHMKWPGIEKWTPGQKIKIYPPEI